VTLGSAAGIALGSDEAYITDTLISEWERVRRGITMLGWYYVWSLGAIVAGWLAADFASRQWRAVRDSDAAGER
jgi:hypothetical protein